MNLQQLVEENLIPRLKSYLLSIKKEQLEYTLDGVKVFKKLHPDDKFDVFLAGKLMNVASFILSDVKKRDSQNFAEWKEVFSSCLNLALSFPIETWGILNFFSGLNKLKNAGIYSEVIDENTESILKEKLDWRTFVKLPELTLISKPTNYYGVAFAIAKYREIFGFEEPHYSDLLLEILLGHIKKYSSEHLFMDETPGQGRYDRYSCLIPGELAEHLYNFKMPANEMINEMLRRSTDIYLNLVNPRGDGFMYGRSIGVYGDNSALEVLSMVAVSRLLSSNEVAQVYAYNLATVKKYIDFWIDGEMNSLNMWEKGRRTDSYRYKGRILGENFSTSMQIIGALEHFQILEMATKELSDVEIKELTKVDNKINLYFLAKDEYDRAMLVVTIRENLIFQLPLINGSNNYFDKAPYYPVPQMSRVIEMPPECNLPYLWPHFKTKDGRILSPLIYYKNINLRCENNISYLTFEIDGCSEIKLNSNLDTSDQSSTKNISSVPVFVSEIKSKVEYIFTEDAIEMKLTYQDDFNLIVDTNLLFGTFNQVLFSKNNEIILDGEIFKFSTENLVLKNIKSDESWFYETNHGAYKNIIIGNAENIDMKCLKWKITFK